ncbi:hypothetical protein ASZ90_000439 [hydrocarbon metagenome]|uniref:Uncharacterized protein n=1 Tax=hydrocarbon metagenome TaxID=938273 RepID=A0A0W8G964_9ZZZZ
MVAAEAAGVTGLSRHMDLERTSGQGGCGMKPWKRIVTLCLAVVFAAGMLGCAGANTPGSKQAEIFKRMQTSHRNN